MKATIQLFDTSTAWDAWCRLCKASFRARGMPDPLMDSDSWLQRRGWTFAQEPRAGRLPRRLWTFPGSKWNRHVSVSEAVSNEMENHAVALVYEAFPGALIEGMEEPEECAQLPGMKFRVQRAYRVAFKKKQLGVRLHVAVNRALDAKGITLETWFADVHGNPADGTA